MLRYLAVPAMISAIVGCSPAEDSAAVDAPDAPATEESAVAPSPTRDEDIEHFLLQEYPDAGTIRYATAWVDLNGDGADEAIVYVAAPYFCGTGGCPTLVLTQAGPMWSKVGDISVSRTPIGLPGTTTNGWSDLTVSVGGGGGQSGTALLKFEGESYPSNPTVPPAEMTDTVGTIVLAEEPDFKTAEPVAPAE